MTRLSVWAPQARQVEVVFGDTRHEMRPEPRGYWQCDPPELAPGGDYAFSLDGGPPRPDPRSAWQPAGVHGPSRLVDHTSFAWSDAGFAPVPLSQAVFYELHVGTFGRAGTFDGVVPHLDHLAALGVTHVELMPVAAFPGKHGWGYDGVALFAPHAPYGGPEGLRRLVDACHARGLGVILDVVYNHLGPSGNYLAEYGPYFTDRYRTPWGAAVNLDAAHCDEARRFFLDNAVAWLAGYHVDGLRLDAVHAMVDTGATHFLEELAAEVQAAARRLGRCCLLIAESDLNDPRLVTAPDSGGYGLDAMWSDDFHHALHAVLTGERGGYYEDFGTVAALAKAAREGVVYDGEYSRYRRRRHGRRAVGLQGQQLVVCCQNHDQIGNRARGERLGQLTDPESAMVAAAVVLTSQYVPLLFQGEEWAASSPFLYFTDHREQELADAVRDGRRREFAAFGWRPEEIPDPQAADTFHRSRLIWDELGRQPHARVLAWYRSLLGLRRSERELQAGAPGQAEVSFDEQRRWLLSRRGRFAMACTLGPEQAAIPLPPPPAELLLDSSSRARIEDRTLHLPGRTAVVLRLAAGSESNRVEVEP
ncbi:MAG: malto-oligosyltrehalose trehalohydrolase [Deltaproteobacteria bacterium]|nr:malto-oligosyltrehalose trehalohydrolase [Deltaproteobacteria bacterium]